MVVGCISGWGSISSSVLFGSLSFVYINDLGENVAGLIGMFTDSTTLAELCLMWRVVKGFGRI